MTIEPHSIDNYHNLATLTIQCKDGSLQTPARATNRYDHNAKNQIGADISLMEKSKCFILQEKINIDKLEKIMKRNGYLGDMSSGATRIFERFGEGLKLFYPSFTKPTLQKIKNEYSVKNKEDLINFLCDVVTELNQEALILPAIYDIGETVQIMARHNQQLIPVLDMKDDNNVFSKNIKDCIDVGSSHIPITALQFSTYAKANLAYRHVMETLDRIHEGKQAVMVVDSPRAIYSEDYNSISALHYSPFFVADLTVERYIGGGGPNTSTSVRLFSKENLTVPYTDSGILDVKQEGNAFMNDPKLQALLNRMVANELTDADWKNSKPRYLSRIHENMRSHPEFRTMQRNIKANSVLDYLEEKHDMNKVIKRELQDSSGRV